MRRWLVAFAIVLGVVVAYVLTHLALIEIGQEIVILEKWEADGTISRPRLWIVDQGGYAWLHHGYADTSWIRRLETDPFVTVIRGGERQRYRATPVPEADPMMHSLLREKYGFADRFPRFWAGTDTERGVATGETCIAVPVRLELEESP